MTHTTIPLVDLKANYRPLKAEIVRAIEDCLEGMQLFLGPNVRAFEAEFAAYCTARHCLGVSNGTDALHLALRGLGIGPGDEVITVSHTFIATCEAIWLVGARPVFVDVDPRTYTLDPEKLAAAITSRTKAIIPVHLYGLPADMAPILAIARRHGLNVIEDACQAQGAEYLGSRTGVLGHVACYSFYMGKNLGAYGEAGAVVTDDPALHEEMRSLRDHGSEQKYRHPRRGINARLDELHAAVLRIKLRHLEAWNELRRRHAATYRELLAGSGVTLPDEPEYARHVYHLFAILTPEREALRQFLAEHGVQTGIHYPVPVHLQPAAGEDGLPAGSLPVTERLARQELSLPLYPELTQSQLERVAELVTAFSRRRVAQPV